MIMTSSRLLVGLTLVGFAALGAGCGDLLQSSSPLTVKVLAPSQVEGAITDQGHTCDYEIEVRGEGPEGAQAATWEGATVVLMSRSGDGFGGEFRSEVSATELARWFGSKTIARGERKQVVLQTWLSPPPGVEVTGATGAHRARWTLRYSSAGENGEAPFTIECLPDTRELFLKVTEARTGIGVAAVTVRVGNFVFQSDENGFVRDPRFVAGRYPIEITSSRHQPVHDTAYVTGAPLYYELSRLAPSLDRFAVRFDSISNLIVVTEWHDPAGAESLPAEIAVIAAGPMGTDTVRSAASESLDASRVRYTFPGMRFDTNRLVFTVTSRSERRATFACTLYPGTYDVWDCREQR